MENEVMYIKLDDIIPNRFQPREVFDEKALNELADSIRQHGVIEPIIVRPVSNKYEIIAGERRYKASAIAGLTKIPAIVRDMDDKESSLVAYIENAQRRDVSAIEEAKTAERIMKQNNMTQEELARNLGISQSALANKIRLLSLPLEIQDALMKNEISERHARSLLSVKSAEKQIELLNKIKEKRMTVRELESEIKAMNNSFNYNDNMANNYVGNTNFIPNMSNAQDNFMNNNVNSSQNNYNNMNMGMQNDFGTNASLPNNGMNNGFDNPNNMNSNQNMGNNTGNDSSFMSFLNNYDNKPQPVENNQNNMMNSTNGDNSGFMNFLNNYDNGNVGSSVINNENKYAENEVKNNNNEFMQPLNNSFLNPTIDTNNNQYNNSNVDTTNKDFFGNLNDNENLLINDNLNDTTKTDDFVNNNLPNSNYNIPNINSNLVINDVNPPITSNFNANGYIEDNPNYVDVSKQDTIDNVNEIIEELKTTIDKIKSRSTFKIDTDEINFDDIYQITIKIDKRDFL